jgi:hypothetical protein
LLTRCQATDGHDKPPIRSNTLACDQAIRPAVWRYLKMLSVLQ